MKTGSFSCRISSVGRRGVTIIDQNGVERNARIAGRIYHELQPVTGDYAVAVESGELPLVEEILPRNRVLQRTAASGSSTQVIASNVDIALVVVSIKQPDFSNGFVCRALAGAEWKKLPATVVLNKMDLLSKSDEHLESSILNTYGPEGADYPIFPVSCSNGRGMQCLLDHIEGKTVVMTGPSGAGKTSLVKYYNPALDVKIGALNPKTSRGKHTTVSALLIQLDKHTAVIDTPGLRMFSIDHIPLEELQFCFPEFAICLGECKFRDCLHMSEPGCAVKSAAESGAITEIRYSMYVDFMNEKKG
jgi:ribosome biogenesis GTPase / thiamine phosphate phosphatase